MNLPTFFDILDVQVSPRQVEGSTQVEEADTAVAKAQVVLSYLLKVPEVRYCYETYCLNSNSLMQAFMYGEEEPDIEYWKQLAEKRRYLFSINLKVAHLRSSLKGRPLRRVCWRTKSCTRA